MKERFIYREFLFFQLELQFIRDCFRERRRVNRYRFRDDLRRDIDRLLPFPLSEEQVAAFSEIVNDLSSPQPMRRLLQGEVGSGKTIVAFLALLLARANGHQGAFLAPTEILARQHYQNACSFFGCAGVALLTGGSPTAEARETRSGLANGDISLVFGTHALIGEQVIFKNLALVVIDEQHRFGVAQRAALFFKSRAADLLVTTATPIPRTMLLALYNDLAVSTLKKPLAGRLPVATRIIAAADRDKFYLRLKGELERGRKGFVILPLIEKSEQYPDLRSLQQETLAGKTRWPGIPQAALSGKSTPEHKERVLKQFRKGGVRLLLATTVVEVGIDVSDATFMVIENADRYGLAQLHQLRGRVGRGGGAVALFPDRVAPTDRERQTPPAGHRRPSRRLPHRGNGSAAPRRRRDRRPGAGRRAGFQAGGQQERFQAFAGSANRRPPALARPGLAEPRHKIIFGFPGR